MDNKELENGVEVMTKGASTFERDEDEKYIADLTQERRVQYCSMIPKNEEDEIILFNAMNSSDKRIADCINQIISIRHIYVEVVTCVNEENGHSQLCPRVVLIDNAGVSYQCVSMGIYSCIKKMLSIKGSPDKWKNPVNVKVEQVTRGSGNNVRKILTLKMVAGERKK